MSSNHESREQTKLLHEILNALRHEADAMLKIEHTLCHLSRKLFPVPTRLILTIEGEPVMGAPISKPVGQTVHFAPTEFDTLTTPPTPFPIVPANQVYTQDVTTFGTLVVNPDGSADLTGTAAGVVTVTDTDSVSNPNLVLSDSVVVTFYVPAEVPNQLILTAS